MHKNFHVTSAVERVEKCGQRKKNVKAKFESPGWKTQGSRITCLPQTPSSLVRDVQHPLTAAEITLNNKRFPIDFRS